MRSGFGPTPARSFQQLAASGTARQRFAREAQAAAAVRDDHVVAIHAVNVDGPVPYLVMEFIGGITLDDRIQQCGVPGVKELTAVRCDSRQVSSGFFCAD